VPDAARRKRAVVRTTFTIDQPARANVPARGLAQMCHGRKRPPTIQGIRFAPKRSLSPSDLPQPEYVIESKADMTANLISLALAWLIAIALCEPFE
jgi:hypothetical protein